MTGLSAAEKPIRISGKEAEEVGFDKIAKRLAELHELRIVLLDGLNIHHSVPGDVLELWSQPPGDTPSTPTTDIRDVCPKITELDLGRNLFTSIHQIAAICGQLEHLKSLRVDGNRFHALKISSTERQHFKRIFAKVENLTLDSTLLTWPEIVDTCSCFTSLRTLSISSNEFYDLDPTISLADFPALETIKLETNRLTALTDISTLSTIPSLRRIILKYSYISAAYALASQPTLFSHITDLDVSFNNIASWTFINDVGATFPALTSLRISHNPLYSSLFSPAGRELTPDDGYMLTIARLPHLQTLNFSSITEKDRLNAETYYISLVVQELSLAPESETAKIMESHPRWRELCEEYGEPTIKRTSDHVDPRSLAARLLTLEFSVSPEAARLFNQPIDEKATVKNVPKRFNVYSVLGAMARAYGQNHVAPGLSLNLVTEDWEEVNGQREKRVIRLVPETRGIGTFLEDGERIGHVRVEYEEPARNMGERMNHAIAGSLLGQIIAA